MEIVCPGGQDVWEWNSGDQMGSGSSALHPFNRVCDFWTIRWKTVVRYLNWLVLSTFVP